MWNQTTPINSHAPSAYDLDVGWVSRAVCGVTHQAVGPGRHLRVRLGEQARRAVRVRTTSAELALQAAELAPADFREEDVGEKPSKVHP